MSVLLISAYTVGAVIVYCGIRAALDLLGIWRWRPPYK